MKYLFFRDVIRIHERQINAYGHRAGLRDAGLLQSAIAQPYASFQGHPLHPTIDHKAGAYLYHITQNHAFLDGNKRTSVATTLMFYRWNQIRLGASNLELYELVRQVAMGKLAKRDVTAWLQQRPHEPLDWEVLLLVEK